MDRTITPQGLAKLRREKQEDILILDVRRKSDYEADRHIISGAIWRDPDQVDQWSEEIPRDKQVIIYCVRGGSVSNAVLDRLYSKNIKARYIEGGISAWREAVGLGRQGDD